MRIHVLKAAVAGLAGTAAMTALLLMAPRMGLPPMNIGHMLGSVMGGHDELGWAAHFMIGTALAVLYAAAFAGWLPGPGAVRGTLFGVGPWLMAQLVVMPMMGLGIFSGSVPAAVGSLAGHMVYGAVLGLVYSERPERRPASRPVRA